MPPRHFGHLQTLRRDEVSATGIDNGADPVLDARVLCVRRNSAGDRHREFRNAVFELFEFLGLGGPALSCGAAHS